jgi:hypothetical protein
MDIKRQFWKFFLIILLSLNNLQAKPFVIERKVISENPVFWADLFIDKDDRAIVIADGPFGEDYIWLNDKMVSLKEYGGCLNGFIKDGRMYLSCLKDKNIDIYSVEKDIVLENRAAIGTFPTYPVKKRVIYVSGDSNIFYLQGSRQQLPRNPVDFMIDVLSGGHGVHYEKPVWAEIRSQKLLEYQKIPYGGKIDESFHIEEVLTRENTMYLFGFKNIEWPAPALHYSEYNVKKKKLLRSQDIYKESPDFNSKDRPKSKNLYVEWSSNWNISAGNFNDDLFIVFSWQRYRFSRRENRGPDINVENVNMPIYYSQNNGKGFGNAEVIGQGILPIVRSDSFGNIYVIWSNSNGDLVYKEKKDNIWRDENVIVNNTIDSDKVWQRMGDYKHLLRKISAEFDRDNHLHVVFASKGKLVYAKIGFN